MPAPFRWSPQHAKDEFAERLASLVMGAEDGEPHFSKRTYYTVYPTRPNTESLVHKALDAFTPDWLGGYGLTLDECFDATQQLVERDPGEDVAAMERLAGAYMAIATNPETGEVELWSATVEQVNRAAKVIAAAEPGSLWWECVTKVYPDHPQTPGSAKYKAAEATGGPHESVAWPWTRRR